MHRGLEAVEEDKHLLAQLAFADVTGSDSDGEVDDTSAVLSDSEAESAPSENERIRHLRTKRRLARGS